jgi:hypothetical protein
MQLASTKATSKMLLTTRDSTGFETNRTTLNKTCSDRFNYSIVDPKELSQIGQFLHSKIEKSKKLDKEELMNIEIEEREANDHRKLGNVYIDMQLHAGRKPNVIVSMT